MTTARELNVDPARGHTAPPEPVLSVVVPTHDVAPWIDELLESVLACSFPDLEVLVVDDHSTDGTLERIQALAAADPRVVLVQAHDRGGARARNTGLAVARGRYVAFADADDIVPTGSYERLVGSLETSGSDIAFGDWLKFSSTRTWQPSRNWKVFDEDRIATTLSDVPALVRGRAVWNKVFRRSFLTETGITFPEVPRSNDIVPMTRAYLAAGRIDVLSDCVYLYRDRPGTGSMTSRAGAAAAAVSYFTQEAACAALVRERDDEGLTATYSTLVHDADSWLHLSRVLREIPVAELRESGAVDAVLALVANAPRTGLARATPHKQVLWALVAGGHLDVAERFNRAEEHARAAGSYDAPALAVWIDAIAVLLADDALLAGVDRTRLVVDGLGRVLLHHARDLSVEDAVAVIHEAHVAGIVGKIDVSSVRTRSLAALLRAVEEDDAAAVRLVSAGRDARLVVDAAALEGTTVVFGGVVTDDGPDGVFAVVLRSPSERGAGDRVRIPAERSGDRWSVRVPATAVGAGRWEVSVEIAVGRSTIEVPVVTARMPLPVPERADRFRVLADRGRSWRVVLERRPAVLRRAIGRVVRRG